MIRGKIFIRRHYGFHFCQRLYSRLIGIQFKVPAFLFYQFLMSTAFGNGPMFNNQNLIGLSDGTQAMGYNKCRPPAHQASQAFLDEGLTFRIQIGRRLIQ